MNGRTIKVFLADGIPDGLRTAEIMNWTGQMLVFPRSQLSDYVQRPEAGRTGIYVLIGDDQDDPIKERIYIGESDSVSERLQQHAKDSNKDFWSRTIVVISKDENLSKAHVRHLESRLIALAKQAQRAVVANGNSGTPVALSESDIADMEFFLSQIQMLLPVLGYPFAQPLPTITPESSVNGSTRGPSASPTLTMVVGNATATAVEINGLFIVRAGSKAKATPAEGIGYTYRQKREAFWQSGKLIGTSQAGLWEFTEDTPFDSPSAAAAVIQGYNINGRKAWLVSETQQPYKDWQEAQLAAVSTSTSDNSTAATGDGS